jgi:hypothetical protein
METMYYIGLDVHKKTISYCVKDGSGRIYAAGSIPATRLALDMWMKNASPAVDGGHGSDHLHSLDLRSSPCSMPRHAEASSRLLTRSAPSKVKPFF